MIPTQSNSRHPYLLLAARHGDVDLSPGVHPEMKHLAHFVAGSLHATVMSAVAIPNGWLQVSDEPSNNRITLTEGLKLGGDPAREIQSGSYNEIVLDGQRDELVVRNDFIASLPLYFTVLDRTLVLGNSLRLIQELLALPADESAVAQTFLLAGWTVDERTVVAGVRTVAAGRRHTFSAEREWQLSEERLVRTWTGVQVEPMSRAVAESGRLWEQAMARVASVAAGPVGVMLSGGLDSRMVAAGFTRAGVPLICLTHGDTAGGEAQIARAVANALDAPWVTNALDETFPYEALNIHGIHADLGLVFNPMWHRSGLLLSQQGVRMFSSGAALEGLLGGQKSRQFTRRFVTNLVGPVVSPQSVRPVSESELETLVNYFGAQIRKRQRNYGRLLSARYRQLIDDYAAGTIERIRQVLGEMSGEGRPTLQQLHERFEHEQLVRKRYTFQDLQLTRFGQVLLPTYDLDFAEYVTNLAASLKYDHRLYYKLIRSLYPDMAAIPTANLGVGVDRVQYMIEMARVWGIVSKSRPTSWVNFEAWIRLGDRLDKHEAMFLENGHFFDRDAIQSFFSEVRNSQRRLYDGNETLAFLSLALSLRKETKGGDLVEPGVDSANGVHL